MPRVPPPAYRCVVHEYEDPEPYPTVLDRQDHVLATAISSVALVIVVLASILVVVGA